jgi:hypothetical protein
MRKVEHSEINLWKIKKLTGKRGVGAAPLRVAPLSARPEKNKVIS